MPKVSCSPILTCMESGRPTGLCCILHRVGSIRSSQWGKGTLVPLSQAKLQTALWGSLDLNHWNCWHKSKHLDQACKACLRQHWANANNMHRPKGCRGMHPQRFGSGLLHGIGIAVGKRSFSTSPEILCHFKTTHWFLPHNFEFWKPVLVLLVRSVAKKKKLDLWDLNEIRLTVLAFLVHMQYFLSHCNDLGLHDYNGKRKPIEYTIINLNGKQMEVLWDARKNLPDMKVTMFYK